MALYGILQLDCGDFTPAEGKMKCGTLNNEMDSTCQLQCNPGKVPTDLDFSDVKCEAKKNDDTGEVESYQWTKDQTKFTCIAACPHDPDPPNVGVESDFDPKSRRVNGTIVK